MSIGKKCLALFRGSMSGQTWNGIFLLNPKYATVTETLDTLLTPDQGKLYLALLIKVRLLIMGIMISSRIDWRFKISFRFSGMALKWIRSYLVGRGSMFDTIDWCQPQHPCCLVVHRVQCLVYCSLLHKFCSEVNSRRQQVTCFRPYPSRLSRPHSRRYGNTKETKLVIG